MTSEEMQILEQLRSLKMQAREIKSRLDAIQPKWRQWIDDLEGNQISMEARSQIRHLEELKAEWKHLEQEYKEARHRRMLALGHEDL